MTTVRGAVVLGVLSAALLAGGAVRAADNHYALVGISNPTNLTIHYEFRWGEHDEWQSYTLEPGENRWHSWAYSYRNQDASPTPYIRFDEDLSPAQRWRNYSLTAYAAPYKEYECAKEYYFQESRDGVWLYLYAR